MEKIQVDCVEMVRKIRDGLFIETKDMTKEELIEFDSQPAKNFEYSNNKKSKLKAA
ncbi:MAG: hypothetical protein HQM10_00635 [Candidatus Riflebacteria bacterium]|nr:hypothetical protein [Candidatus Riflebacteria bacterium]